MTGIYWHHTGEGAGETYLKTYSATTKSNGETIFKVEIATTDPHEVSHILRQLNELKAKQKVGAARQNPRSRDRQPVALAAPILRLTHRRDTE